MNICSPIRKHYAPFSDTGRVHNMFTIDRNKSLVNFTESNVLRLQKPNHSRRGLISARSLSQPITLTTWKSLLHELHQADALRINTITRHIGHPVAQLVEALRYKARSRVRFPLVLLEFFIDIILPAALWTWSWLSL